MGAHFFIDDAGELRLESALTIVPDLAAGLCEQKARDYLVRNLGYVSITPRADRLHVRMRPDIVNERTLVGLYFLLVERSEPRLVGEWFSHGTWITEILPEGFRAQHARIRDVVLERRNLDVERILRQEIDISELPEDCPLRTVHMNWKSQSGALPSRDMKSVIQRALHGHYVWIDADDITGTLSIAEVGPGVPQCARAWLSRSIGIHLEHQPDTDYGHYCSTVYRAVARRRFALVEHVDALVDWPGFGEQRRTYRRLIAPYTTAGGKVRLLSASFADSSINLRRLAG